MDAQRLEDLVTTWVEGWAKTRDYEPARSGRAIVIARPDLDGLVERVIVSPSTEEIEALADEMSGPDRLSVITTELPAALAAGTSAGLAPRDEIETFMTTDIQNHDVEAPLAPGDGIEARTERNDSGAVSVEVTLDGEPAARGSMAVVGSVAIFDRIVTEERFRRRGLASYVMRYLVYEALEDDVETGLLAASADGERLYTALGWKHVASLPIFERRGA